MSVKTMSEYTRIAKYAQHVPEKKRRETWSEQADRVFNMHATRFESIMDKLHPYMDEAKAAVKARHILGSQRALQFAGPSLLRHNAKIYNCSYSHANRVRFFQETMYLLLCGAGVGFSVQKQHVALLPNIAPRSRGKKTYVVPDSIEGWADALGILVASYFVGKSEFTSEFSGYEIEFDFSEIRPEGALIKSSGHKAPGPNGLQNSLNKISEIFERALNDGQESLRTIDVYDITMHASDAVLSGGVRRSATICLFSKDDELMLNAKTGNWFYENPQRGRSNNSVLLMRDSVTRDEWAHIMKSVREFGEPGFVFTDDLDIGLNPCCVSPRSLITTADGVKFAKELIGTQYTALIDGKEFRSSERGFWVTDRKPVYKVKTIEGYVFEGTLDHRMKTPNGWVEVGELVAGDKLIINDHRNITWGGAGNSDEGWLLGNLVGDGTYMSDDSACLDYWGEHRSYMIDLAIGLMDKCGIDTSRISGGEQVAAVGKRRFQSVGLAKLADKFGIRRGDKTGFKPEVEKASSEFYAGFIGGLFDADGTISTNRDKGVHIRLTTVDSDLAAMVQRMLLRLGILSKIYRGRGKAGLRRLPDGKGSYAEYECKEVVEVHIGGKSVGTFMDRIVINHPERIAKLAEIRAMNIRWYNQKYHATFDSIEYVGDEDVLDCTVPGIKSFDANGFVVHNCEIGLDCIDDNGNTGFSFCNLCEINGRHCTTEEKFYDACRASAILGTMQAAYTTFDYMFDPLVGYNVTERIAKNESLLGCSITGIQDSPEILLNPEILRKGAEIVKAVNEEVAAVIGIPTAARTTTVKPAGTTSLLLRTASGIHYHHAKRYFRRIQANRVEAPLGFYEMFNPDSVETSVWSNNGTDKVITFLCEVPKGARTRNNLGASDLLEDVKNVQQNWVIPGTRPERSKLKNITHNVSNTINVRENEWDLVEEYIYNNRQWFAGISLLSSSGDLDYPQAPFQAVHTPEEIAKMYGDGSLMASGLIVDALRAFNDNLWLAVDAVSGKGLADLNDEQNDWVRRAKKFAENYFSGDYRKMGYCLKEVASWKKWCDLTRVTVDVPWEEMYEERAVQKSASDDAATACAGGACEVKAL